MMRQVAVAFATTGVSPREGHRICEIVAVDQINGGQIGRKFHFKLKTDETQIERQTFVEVFAVLDDLIGDAQIVVYDAGQWRRFLRPELQVIKDKGAKRWMTQTLDVRSWAYQAFPRQRKELNAIARKMDIAAPDNLSGLESEAWQLLQIARAISDPVKSGAEVIKIEKSVLQKIPIVEKAKKLGFVSVVRKCWYFLSGRKHKHE